MVKVTNLEFSRERYRLYKKYSSNDRKNLEYVRRSIENFIEQETFEREDLKNEIECPLKKKYKNIGRVAFSNRNYWNDNYRFYSNPRYS